MDQHVNIIIQWTGMGLDLLHLTFLVFQCVRCFLFLFFDVLTWSCVVSCWLCIYQDEKPCPYYMRTGSCKFGVACKFHHPQTASPGAGLPVNGPGGSAILPSSGVPYAGGLPAWSLPRAPYVSGPRLQTQSYMPVVVSPSQSIIPAHGWSTYMVSEYFFCWVMSIWISGSNVMWSLKSNLFKVQSFQGVLFYSVETQYIGLIQKIVKCKYCTCPKESHIKMLFSASINIVFDLDFWFSVSSDC